MTIANRINNRGLLLFIAGISLFRYGLTAGMPLSAHGDGIFDSLLFINLAHNISNLEWLGDYDKLTLVKAPFYSIFIAINYLLGWQFKATEHAIFIMACVIFYFAIAKASGRRYLSLLPFVILLFNPYFHTAVERGWLYTALIILFLAMLLHIYACQKESATITIRQALLLGVVFACIYLTREEAIWLAPTLLLSLYLYFSLQKRPMAVAKISRQFIALGAGFAIPIASIALINHAHYGFFGITDASDRAFRSSIKTMKQVQAGQQIQFVDVSQSALNQMYKLSPTLAQLKPYLSGPLGRNWGKLFCKREKQTCGEIGGGYFFWALRDAVAAAGHFTSYSAFHAFFHQVSEELRTQCLSAQLDCSRSIWPTRYPIRWDQLPRYWEKMPAFLIYSLSGLFHYRPDYSSPYGEKNNLEKFALLANTSLHSNRKTIRLSGWLLSPYPDKYLAVTPSQSKPYESYFSLANSPQLSLDYQGNAYAGLSAFTTEGQCNDGACDLLLMSGDRYRHIEKDNIKPGADLFFDGMRLHIDTVESRSTQIPLPHLTQTKIDFFVFVGVIYGNALIYAISAAVIIYLFAAMKWIRYGYRSLLFAFGLLCFVAFFSRIGVLMLFDDFTQAPVIGQTRHFFPSMALLLMFFCCSLMVLADLLLDRPSTIASVKKNT